MSSVATANTNSPNTQQLKPARVYRKKWYRNSLSRAVGQYNVIVVQLGGLLTSLSWSTRATVTSNLVHRLMSYEILYVRGAPASGKTVSEFGIPRNSLTESITESHFD